MIAPPSQETAGSAARVAAGLAVDSLGYLWLDGMVDAVGEGGPLLGVLLGGVFGAVGRSGGLRREGTLARGCKSIKTTPSDLNQPVAETGSSGKPGRI